MVLDAHVYDVEPSWKAANLFGLASIKRHFAGQKNVGNN
jgi:hypothetical protein